MRLKNSVGLWLLTLGACTPEPVPTRIELASLPAQIEDTNPIDLKPVLYDQNNQVMQTVFTFTVNPVGADLLSPGIFTCRKAGDYEISVSSGPVRSTQKVMCRPLGKLVVPQDFKLKRTDPAKLDVVKVLDPTGQSMAGLNISVLSSDVGVVAVAVQDGQVTFSPMGPGKATVSYQVGPLSGKTEVDVTDKPVETTFSLSPGQESSWSLPPGLYSVEVSASGPVSVRIPGALGAGCDSEQRSEVWKLRCVLDAPSVVAVQFPSVFLFLQSSGVSGGIAVERLPSQQ